MGDAPRSSRGEHRVSGEHGDAAAGRRRLRLRSRVGERLDLDAGRLELERQLGAAVVAGDHDGAPARSHAVERQQAPCRPAKHHAGQVVVLEDHRVFESARGDDDLAGAEPDEAISLEHAEQVVLVEPEGRRAGEDPDPFRGRDLCAQVPRHLPARASGLRARVEPPAAPELRLVVHEQHARTPARGLQRPRHAGRAAADHRDVREEVRALVLARRFLGEGDASEPREPPEDALVRRPEPARMDEGLVVEAHGEQEVEPVEDRESVPLERGPGVLGLDPLAVAQGLHAGADVRHAVDVDQAVRAVAAAAEQPARPVVLEAPAEDPHTGRVERRADAVAGEARERPARERERDQSRPVDPLGRVDREPLGPHGAGGQEVASTRFTLVSRVARNQRRQPARWNHHSCCGPASFRRK